MPGGIKELIADVEVKDVDLALDVGRWAVGSFISGTTTWTGTAAFTVLMGMLRVTASAAGMITMGTAGDADAVFACTSTLATTFASGAGLVALNASVNVVTAQNSGMPEISAGGSVIISAGDSVAGKYYFLYIKTPT
jgi:hypothetical protein